MEARQFSSQFLLMVFRKTVVGLSCENFISDIKEPAFVRYSEGAFFFKPSFNNILRLVIPPLPFRIPLLSPSATFILHPFA